MLLGGIVILGGGGDVSSKVPPKQLSPVGPPPSNFLRSPLENQIHSGSLEGKLFIFDRVYKVFRHGGMPCGS